MAKDQEILEKKDKKEKKRKKAKEKKPKKSNYLKEVYMEMKKVTFPSFKSVVRYTFATILFCGFVVLFFLLLNFLLSVVKGMF